MTTSLTTQYLKTFADTVRQYLKVNGEYRSARKNPNRKEELRISRNNAYRAAQEAGGTLNKHISTLEYSGDQTDSNILSARNIINHWAARNTAYANLSNPFTTNKKAATATLDKAEKALRAYLKTVEDSLDN